jgi:hypothetical protein
MIERLQHIDKEITSNQSVIRSYMKAGAFFTTGQRMIKHEELTTLARLWEYDLAK